MQRELIGLLTARTTEPQAWERVVDSARTTGMYYELPEVLWFAARSAARAGDRVAARGWLDQARTLVADHTSWSHRFDAITTT